MMNPDTLAQTLKQVLPGELQYLQQTGSTNDEAATWAEGGAPDLSLVMADEQTAGRGRAGRRWFTPPGSALAMTLIIRPAPAERGVAPGCFAGLGALALADVLSKHYRLPAEVKWPNDVLVGARKIAGVLVEAAWEGAMLRYVLVGMGLNVSPEAVPPAHELNFPATCLEAETSLPVMREVLAAQIVQAVIALRLIMPTPLFIHNWEDALAFKAEEVEVRSDEGVVAAGWISGITQEGQLRLRTARGIRTFSVGELRLRPVDRTPK